MTELNQINPRRFEIFAPRVLEDGTPEWDRLTEGNEGVAGRDPYPKFGSDLRLKFAPGESVLGSWTARSLRRGIRPATPRTDWVTDADGWLHEELVSQGGVQITLTDYRIAFFVSDEFVNVAGSRCPEAAEP